MGPGSQAKGVAVVLGGLTVSNVIGVPLITRLGQAPAGGSPTSRSLPCSR